MAETPILIGIAGGTGSGKSTVVRALKERFGQHEVTVIEQDYYYKANRHLPLDLRPASFPVGSVASTAFHHVGVTLWRSDDGFELFLPRGFALSLWEMLLESAAQFGGEVV